MISATAFEATQAVFEPLDQAQAATPQGAAHVHDHDLAPPTLDPSEPRVVVCVDGSAYADNALEWTLLNLATTGAARELVLLHVVSARQLAMFWQANLTAKSGTTWNPAEALARRMADSMEHEYFAQLTPSKSDEKAALAQLASVLLDKYVAFADSCSGPAKRNVHLRTHVILSSSPKETICQFANSMHPQCIVVGRTGTTLKSIFMGSTAKYCVHNCSVPVVVVPLNATAAAAADAKLEEAQRS
ncbi:hypothetical protein HK105_201965 [Polyrhizophydium stewartii]|uniref:UspA domain-containing protein n=1 Tax=Polyrhizophydium stewartii TaxID=2732419 RepID=A0ABR4NG97_9FUNG|nr:hypothetical protein HK105_001303 [Polyrhizophydium stewartii]